MINEPYLSIVVTTRNDDHGGDPLKRLQAFVNCFEQQCRQTGLSAELIVVEWNPPDGRPRVADLLCLPEPARCSYRFIDVPPELHASLRYADVLPLFQMIAKNVGIRRARGAFVLATNIDIIFSTELVEYLASRRLQPHRLYRVDRHDMDADFPVNAALAAQMDYCRSHQLRVHQRWGTYPTNRDGTPVSTPGDIVDGRTVRLGRGWHTREDNGGGASARWASAVAELVVDPTACGLDGAAVVEIDLESNPHAQNSAVAISVVENGSSLEEVTVSGRMLVEVALGRASGAARRLELIASTDAADQRTSVPLFNLRSGMYFRVHGVRVLPVVDRGPVLVDYPPEGWSHADRSPHISAVRTRDGVVVSTDPAQYSYCLQQGPFRASRRGRYRFVLRYRLVEGGISFGVLSGDRQRWLHPNMKHSLIGGYHRIDVSLDAVGNETFWLVIANWYPEGHGVSRFVIRDLRGSESPAVLACATDASGNPPLGLVRDVRWPLSREAIRQRLSAWGDEIVSWLSPRLSPRVRFRMVRAAPEYIAIERALDEAAGRIRELAPAESLTGLHRFLEEMRPENIHVNACGDFQLMAREHWHALNGYPEFETFSMNIDGLFSYIADAAGVKEQVLDTPIFHIEHEVGSGWSPEGEAALRRRIVERGITWLEVPTVYIWAAYMRWLRRPFLFNSSAWGFGDQTLPERVVAPVLEESSR